MPIYSDDSDDSRPSAKEYLFGRDKSLRALLGGGRVADILLWRNKNLSAAILIGFTIIWFLFEVVEYNFITLLCHVSITTMLVLFVWSTGAGYWSPPDLRAITIPESTYRWLFTKINMLLWRFYDISTGRDFKTFFMAIVFLWIVSGIGSLFSSLNLLYICFLGVTTLPALYERYQNEVDHLASRGNRDMKRMLRKFDSKVLNKIPRGPVKERKKF